MRKLIVLGLSLFLLTLVFAQKAGGQPSALPQAAQGTSAHVDIRLPPAQRSEARPAVSAPKYYGRTGVQYPPRSSYRNGGYWHRDHRGWHMLVVYGGWWGYWWDGIWYPIFDYAPYPYAYEMPGWLKLDLGAIPRDERELVKTRGIVYVDGAEIGIVRDFEGIWHAALPLTPGSHEISVVLPDARRMDTTAGIAAGRVTHILIRFSAEKQQQPPPLGP